MSLSTTVTTVIVVVVVVYRFVWRNVPVRVLLGVLIPCHSSSSSRVVVVVCRCVRTRFRAGRAAPRSSFRRLRPRRRHHNEPRRPRLRPRRLASTGGPTSTIGRGQHLVVRAFAGWVRQKRLLPLLRSFLLRASLLLLRHRRYHGRLRHLRLRLHHLLRLLRHHRGDHRGCDCGCSFLRPWRCGRCVGLLWSAPLT